MSKILSFGFCHCLLCIPPRSPDKPRLRSPSLVFCLFYSGFRWLLAAATCSVLLSTSLSTCECVCRRLLASVCCYLPLSICVCLCRLLLAHLGLHCPSVCFLFAPVVFYLPLSDFICLCRFRSGSVGFNSPVLQFTWLCRFCSPSVFRPRH